MVAEAHHSYPEGGNLPLFLAFSPLIFALFSPFFRFLFLLAFSFLPVFRLQHPVTVPQDVETDCVHHHHPFTFLYHPGYGGGELALSCGDDRAQPLGYQTREMQATTQRGT